MAKIAVTITGLVKLPADCKIDKDLFVGVALAGVVLDKDGQWTGAFAAAPTPPTSTDDKNYRRVVKVDIDKGTFSIPLNKTKLADTRVEKGSYLYVVFQTPYTNDEKMQFVLRRNQALLCQARNGGQVIELEEVEYEEAIGCRISGEVERAFGDGEHRSFGGVPVTLLDEKRDEIARVTTDSLGKYCFFTEEAGRFIVRFPADMPTTGGLLTLAMNEIDLHTEKGVAFTVPTVQYDVAMAKIVGQVTQGRLGLKGVVVTAIRCGTLDEFNSERSDELGHYEIELSKPGEYDLSFPTPFPDDAHKVWELKSDQPNMQSMSVTAGQMVMAKTVEYQPEEHKIVWTVTSGGLPGVGKLVEVWDEEAKIFIAEQRTDHNGQAIFDLPEPGVYTVKVYPDDPMTRKARKDKVSVHSTYRGRTEFAPVAARPADPTSGGGGALLNAEVSEAVIDSQAYPILTETVGVTATALPAASPATGMVSLTQTAEKAVRAILGWRPKTGDIQGFKTALAQSFKLENVEGHIEATWTPRSYAVQVQDDLGAITGAQASIYTRAKAALDASLPLLDGLKTLRADIQPDDIEAIRAIVRSEMTQLVMELGVVGGPRVQRVDELFRYLLGPTPSSDPEQVSGHLQELGERLGMQRERVNSVEDEQNYTNYLILIDYIYTLQVSWDNQRKFFDRMGSAEPFLGTQLVLVSQALTAVAEGVQQVYFTMDSVFLTSAERQTLTLNFAGGGLGILQVPGDEDAMQVGNMFTFDRYAAPMTIAELLDWVDRVASEEAPRLIQDSGKDGVIAFFPTINKLRKLVHGSLLFDKGVQDPRRQPLPTAYSTARVQRALEELASQLDDTARLAGQIVAQARQPRTDLTKQALVDALRDPDVVSALRSVVGSGQSGGTPTAPPTTAPAGQVAGETRPSGPGLKFDPSIFDKFDIEVLRGVRPELFSVTANIPSSIPGRLT
jgi:hypothetical protein